MDAALLTPYSIDLPLRACGYRQDLLRRDFSFGPDRTAPLVAFAQSPADSRSACVAVLSATNGSRPIVEACKPLGAPVVFVCVQDALQWWKQGTNEAELLETIPANGVERFFKSHQDKFSPEAIYRAKTWGRFQSSFQLSFVDLGLMPLVEEEVGRSLGKLIERNVNGLRNRLGWGQIDDRKGHWLLQTVFWLVSAKILRDKQVPGFENLDLNDVDDVFRRVGNHYGTEPLIAGSTSNLDALRESSSIISQFSSLILTTTEALAYVYENTLISRATRSALGTHSTPPYLVDYIVGNLAEWVGEIPTNERNVYEPACGHAAFLVSAMRLLAEKLPAERQIPGRRGPYLRSRLHGADKDPFALELARLSLTLTDIPNPDGWDLKVQDMFLDDRLAVQAGRSTILLANPPFDDFSSSERQAYRTKASEVRFLNKSVEMLWRTLPHLPAGGVFGVVLPQTILQSANARDFREFLISECELKKICLFPDGMFSFSDAESAIIIGRRQKPVDGSRVGYHRIRERELPSFRSDYSVANARTVPQSRFSADALVSLIIPELEDLWLACANNPTIADVADVGQGLTYHGESLPSGGPTVLDEQFDGSWPGFVSFGRGLQLHELPKSCWMSLDHAVISRPRSGAAVGIPQVLLNYAPVSRGPWRLKAWIDTQGHAVTSRFVTVRPTRPAYSIRVLWALLNSPVGNAYAYSHLGKRDNTVGVLRKLPLPECNHLGGVEAAADAYLAAVLTEGDPNRLRALLLKVDIEVLKLYSLPLGLEHRLLALFNDEKRVGVPFTQMRYLPKTLEGKIHLSDFLQFEGNWSATNRERGRLIDKKISGELLGDEQTRLDCLQEYAAYHIQEAAPRSTRFLDQLEGRLFVSGTEGKDR